MPDAFLVTDSQVKQPTQAGFLRFNTQRLSKLAVARMKTPSKSAVITREDLDDPNQTPLSAARVAPSLYARYGLDTPTPAASTATPTSSATRARRGPATMEKAALGVRVKTELGDAASQPSTLVSPSVKVSCVCVCV